LALCCFGLISTLRLIVPSYLHPIIFSSRFWTFCCRILSFFPPLFPILKPRFMVLHPEIFSFFSLFAFFGYVLIFFFHRNDVPPPIKCRSGTAFFNQSHSAPNFFLLQDFPSFSELPCCPGRPPIYGPETPPICSPPRGIDTSCVFLPAGLFSAVILPFFSCSS